MGLSPNKALCCNYPSFSKNACEIFVELRCIENTDKAKAAVLLCSILVSFFNSIKANKIILGREFGRHERK